MKIAEDRALLSSLLASVEIPGFLKADYIQEQPEVRDVTEAVRRTVENSRGYRAILPGQQVAITAGSREISHMGEILHTLGVLVRLQGGIPFLVPAMGSHGGATAEGQTEVLRHYGITEESMEMEIRSSMETIMIGKTKEGQDVYLDKHAMAADYIILVGRIKAHTDFNGLVESGLMKMLVIGLGKQQGASICHKLGFSNMGENLLRFGKVILERAPILFGVGIVENGHHGIAKIEAVDADDLLKREPELLQYAKSLMGKIPLDDLDLLIVQEMGKEISGAGMDPNVTGRSHFTGVQSPHAEKIAVLELTEKSGGNSAGMGNADAITRQVFDKIDLMPVYVNGITCRDTGGIRLPAVMPDAELAIRFCLYTCTRRDACVNARVVWIKNTGDLTHFWISESLEKEAEQSKELRIHKEMRREWNQCVF